MTGDGMQHRVGLEPACGLIAIETRQLDVHENEVRPVRCRSCQPRFAIHGFDDLEIGTREQIPQDLPIVFLILDHQDAFVHHGPIGLRPAPEP